MQSSTIEFRSVGKSDQLQEDYVNAYYIDDLKYRVSVARVSGKLYAFNGLCTHEGFQLSARRLTGTTLMCPCHGSQFDIVSGEVVRGPAKQSLSMYQVRERNEVIEVQV